MPKRDPAVPHRGVWIYGAPGVGKSYYAEKKFPGAFYKTPSNRWWDYYNGEKTVVIDEFVGGFLLSDMLLWADRYECKGEVKGAMIQLAHTTTVVLSNLPPWDLYQKVEPIRRKALYRRFEVYEMTNSTRLNGSTHRKMSRRYDPSTIDRLPRRNRRPPTTSEQDARVLAAVAGFRRNSAVMDNEEMWEV